jgi:hypothetical protein
MNGVYHADFKSQIGSGTGTVYLDKGVIRGGDATVAYWGNYTIGNGMLAAEVAILKHGAGFSILGDAKNFNFQGRLDGNNVRSIGTVPGHPVQAQIQLRKVADL